MRIFFVGDQQLFFFQFGENQIDRARIGRFTAGKFAKSVDESAVFCQRGNAHDSCRDSELMVDISASWSDMHDPRAFTCNDVGIALEIASAINDAVTTDRRFFLPSFGSCGTPPNRGLRRQIVEWPGVLPADHLGTFDRPFDLVAPRLLRSI